MRSGPRRAEVVAAWNRVDRRRTSASFLRRSAISCVLVCLCIGLLVAYVYDCFIIYIYIYIYTQNAVGMQSGLAVITCCSCFVLGLLPSGTARQAARAQSHDKLCSESLSIRLGIYIYIYVHIYIYMYLCIYLFIYL